MYSRIVDMTILSPKSHSKGTEDAVTKRKRETIKQLAVLTVRELLLACFDVPFFFGAVAELRPYKRRAYQDYFRERMIDHQKFYRLVHRLKSLGYIETYLEDRERFIELTPKGKQRLAKYVFDDVKLSIPRKWDKKWRIVVFDIPKKFNNVRDILRQTLNRLGFYKLQDSVYVYPHDCIGLIKYIEETYEIGEYVQFVVAERIETEVELIELFVERGLIKDIQNNARA